MNELIMICEDCDCEDCKSIEECSEDLEFDDLEYQANCPDIEEE